MINISTCTPNLAWRPQLRRVWLAAFLTFLVGVLPDDYNSTPRKQSRSGLDCEQYFVVVGDNRSFSIVVDSVDVGRDLVVLLDSEFTMKQHINRVVSIGYYHIRRLRQLRRPITQYAMKRLFFDTLQN